MRGKPLTLSTYFRCALSRCKKFREHPCTLKRGVSLRVGGAKTFGAGDENGVGEEKGRAFCG